MGTVNFWDGDQLPPIGCYIGYYTGSQGTDRPLTDQVSGYEILPHLDGDAAYHRILIKFAGGNCRLLKDCIPADGFGKQPGLTEKS